MEDARDRKRERRNRRVELPSVFGDHLVGAVHRAHRGLEMRSARVFEALARLEQGLLPDDAEAVYFEHLAVRIGDDPVLADELSRNAALMADRDRVGPNVLVLRPARL